MSGQWSEVDRRYCYKLINFCSFSVFGKLVDHQWLPQSSAQFPAQLSKTNFFLKCWKNWLKKIKNRNNWLIETGWKNWLIISGCRNHQRNFQHNFPKLTSSLNAEKIGWKKWKIEEKNWSIENGWKKMVDHQWLPQSSAQFPAQLSKTTFFLKMRKNQMVVAKSSNQRCHEKLQIQIVHDKC